MRLVSSCLGLSILFLLSGPLQAGFFDNLKKQAEKVVQDTAKGVVDSVVPGKAQENEPGTTANQPQPSPLQKEAELSEPELRGLQTCLRRLGYYQSKSDGMYDPGTAAAIQRFQQDRGMPADSKATRKVLDECGRAYRDPALRAALQKKNGMGTSDISARTMPGGAGTSSDSAANVTAGTAGSSSDTTRDDKSTQGTPPKTTFTAANESRISFQHSPLTTTDGPQINIMLSPALAQGETLEVYSNGHLAIRVSPAGFGIQRAGFHIWLGGDRTIAARILDATGNTAAANAVTIATDFPVAQRPPALKKTTDRPVISYLRVRKNKAFFKLEHGLAPGRTGRVRLRGDSCSLDIKVTPYLYKRSNIAFYLDRPPGSMEVASTSSGNDN